MHIELLILCAQSSADKSWYALMRYQTGIGETRLSLHYVWTKRFRSNN